MENIVQTLAIVLPIIALSSVILVVCVNLYLKIRRRFSVRVNCWFCNQWTKVQYDEQNCFECPTCLQYNGFDANGDYNKPIPSQHDELLNQQVPVPKNVNHYPSSNGLCHLCNNNQQLRIYQLANFIPLNEANYDVEIEHFQKQLDKAYKLCSQCEALVKKTIRKQNCLLGLKFSQLRKKGLLLLDLDSSYGISKKAKWFFLKKLVNFMLVGFAFLNLISLLMQLDLSDKNLQQIMPKWMIVWVVLIKNSYSTSLETVTNFGFNLFENMSRFSHGFTSTLLKFPLAAETLPYFSSAWEVCSIAIKTYLPPVVPRTSFESAILLCVVAMLLQFIALLWSDVSNVKRNSLQLSMWAVLAGVQWGYPSYRRLHYVNAFEIAISTIIISSMCFSWNSKNSKPKKTKHIFGKLERSKARRKSGKTVHDALGGLSDNEELEPSFNSPHNSTSKSQSPNSHSVPSSRRPVALPTNVLESQKTPQPSCDTSSTTTARDSLNHSFTSAKSYISDRTSLADTASNFNDSFLKPRSNLEKDLDIDISLNNLHLGNPLIARAPSNNAFYVNTNATRPRPVISPAKLRTVTQNSWVAGGFWRDSNGVLMPVSNFSSLSRSSSQTSGFVSHTGPGEPNQINSLPSSMNNSFCGDFECNSVFSEPLFDLNGTNMMQGRHFNQCCPRLSYQNGAKRCDRIYHPLVNHEQLVYIAPNFMQSCNSMYDVYLNKTVLGNTGSPNRLSPDTQRKYF